MVNVVGMVQDYKSNVPLHMLENKYKVPIHTIIRVLHAVTVNPKRRESASARQEAGTCIKSIHTHERTAQVLQTQKIKEKEQCLTYL